MQRWGSKPQLHLLRLPGEHASLDMGGRRRLTADRFHRGSALMPYASAPTCWRWSDSRLGSEQRQRGLRPTPTSGQRWLHNSLWFRPPRTPAAVRPAGFLRLRSVPFARSTLRVRCPPARLRAGASRPSQPASAQPTDQGPGRRPPVRLRRGTADRERPVGGDLLD